MAEETSLHDGRRIMLLSIHLEGQGIDMKETLSLLFQRGNGAPIELDGRLVRQLFQVEIEDEKKLVIKRKAFKKSPVQGLRLKVTKGEIEVNGERHPDIILWADTSPDCVEAMIYPGPGCQLKFWNVWRMDGIVQAWVGNSGVAISENEGRMVVECSDGTGEADFSSLVVEIEIR